MIHNLRITSTPLAILAIGFCLSHFVVGAPSLPLSGSAPAKQSSARLREEFFVTLDRTDASAPSARQGRDDAILSHAEPLYYSTDDASSGGYYASTQTEQQPPVREMFVINAGPQQQFFIPPAGSQIPKMIGAYVKTENDGAAKKSSSASSITSSAELGGPIINPAAYYLEGMDLESIKPPKCRMVGCDGPIPNDNDIYVDQHQPPSSSTKHDHACHQTFVPLNGCVDGRGYPLGMVCTICCECSAQLTAEMRKSRGFRQGYQAK